MHRPHFHRHLPTRRAVMLGLSVVLAHAWPASAQTASPQSASTAAAALTGRWITESGNLEVEIAPCGVHWCGTVTRVLGNRSMRRGDQDMTPADTRPALGMTLLSGLVPDAAAATLSGDIYNRENAKTYRVRLSLDNPQQMAVRAYVGLPLFGQTQHWQRSTER